MRWLLGLALTIALVAIACGGGDDGDGDNSERDRGGDDSQPAATAASGGGGGSGSGGGSGNSGSTADAAPTPIGPVAENTIQIGDQTWNRTLPMTRGQCSVFKDNGTLPDSANVWGTLDGDDDIRFSSTQLQDGTFQSEVQGENFFWIAGGRSPGVNDLEIELDFDALTVIGEGTYSNLFGDLAAGSFHFKCEPEDQ